jgi:hypothetical protein
MSPFFAALPMLIPPLARAAWLPLAEMPGSAMSVAWLLVLFCILLGLLVVLMPSGRTTEIKKDKDA